MSRYQSLTSLQVTGAAVPSVITRFVQSAQADDLEAAFQEVIDEMIAGSYFLSHIDLAGGGDGHTFMLHTQWAIVQGAGVTFSSGGNPSVFRLFLYQAAQAAALGLARAAAQARVAARFTEPDVDTVSEVDTYLAGAQMGTRFMGGVMTSVTTVPC